MLVLLSVGCLECGEKTEVLGMYSVPEVADAAFEAAVQGREDNDDAFVGGTCLRSSRNGYIQLHKEEADGQPQPV